MDSVLDRDDNVVDFNVDIMVLVVSRRCNMDLTVMFGSVRWCGEFNLKFKCGQEKTVGQYDSGTAIIVLYVSVRCPLRSGERPFNVDHYHC